METCWRRDWKVPRTCGGRMMHVAVLRIGWTQSLWRFIKSCGSDGRSRMDAVSVAWCVALAGGRARLQRRRSDQSAAPAASTSPTDTRHMPHASRLSLPVLTVSNKPVPETSHTSYTPVLHRTPQTTRVSAPAAVASGSGPVPHGGCAPGVRARQRPPASRPRHRHSPAPSPAHRQR